MLVVLLLSLGPSAQTGGSDGQDGDRGPGPLSDTGLWTDSFDDLSGVYVPPGGLIGVEVTGGLAQLKAGHDSGWIASSVISARPGMRYDYVFVDAFTPGGSSINISILNASAEATEIGFANETIDNFQLKGGPYLSILPISWRQYPDLRIQVNLEADGADRPVLRAWTLYFLDVEVWLDDFLWPGKISDHRGLNFTGGNLEVNLTSLSGSGGGDYEEFPPVITSGEYAGIEVFYANAQRDGYNDFSLVNVGGWLTSLAIDDLNGDGYFDLIGLLWVGRLKLVFGESDGTWSSTGVVTLNHPSSPQEVGTGDFNGDDEVDMVVACNSGSSDFSYVYLNNGDGTFVDNADITFSMDANRVSTGDLDGDGYDDILLSDADVAKVFYGGPNGPDTTADLAISTVNCQDTIIEDIDGDGHLDIVLGEYSSGKTRVFLGSRNGPDATADYSLSVAAAVRACEAGDINGDGNTDLLFYSGSGSSFRLYIFEGSSSGWSDSRRHADITHDETGDTLYSADLDKDGYEDVLQIQSIGSAYRLKIWFGGTSWPSTPDIVKACGYDNNVVAAIPKGSGGVRAYRGTFTTEPIQLPLAQDKRWDMLDLTGTMPQNTTMTLSVLDGASGDPITGYEDLTDWNVDLTGIDPDTYWTLQVQVTITSEFNHTTPILDRLLIKWMDNRVWRDEFYGAGKVDGLLGLEVAGGMLQAGALGGSGPQLIFPSIMGDENYTTAPKAFRDAGGLDYLTLPPIEFGTRGTSAVDVTDVNGDGYMDVGFAVHRTGAGAFSGKSPLYLGGPLGIREPSDHRFDTTGAMDILLRDLDRDGHTDVVFAQERKATDDYVVNSTLFWGSADGWSDTPDVEFSTTGASDVEAVDLDGDGLLDLVFACFRGTGPNADSLVFMQNDTGFDGASPKYTLATNGARAVAAGDLNRDSLVDLVVANAFSAGFVEIDSQIHWGKAGGGFETTTTDLPTIGAVDVKVADLDDDDDLDIVFANHQNDAQVLGVDSVVYFNDGSGGFGSITPRRLPTSGATGVTAVDLDGSGWMDLVFSCERDASTYKVPSVVFMGGIMGWSATPDIEIPTEGANDVVAAQLLEFGTGGYMSVPIMLDDPPRETGTVHTLRYSATMGSGITGTLQLVDSVTQETVIRTQLRPGPNELSVEGLFSVREHPSVRAMFVLDGLESGGTFSLDDLWLNWTERVRSPPWVNDMGFSDTSVLRLDSLECWVNVSDGYDLPGDLSIDIQHRLNGTSGWDTFLVGTPTYDEAEAQWKATLDPLVSAPLGVYDFRVTVTDLDGQFSEWWEVANAIEVLNNLPTAPEVHIIPEKALTTSVLQVIIDARAVDVETTGLTYNFTWFKDGMRVEGVTGDTLATFHTSKGQNWSVEVRANDGDDLGPPAFAWVVIENAPPFPKDALPDPELEEDTVDTDWINLMGAFEDPDGDPITWSVVEGHENLTVTIDHTTGVVTIEPDPDWWGTEDVIFRATDGEFTTSQSVTVNVLPVNDIPVFHTVDGQPVTGDTITYTIKQGELLEIRFSVADVEGDEVVASVNSSAVTLDEDERLITFQADNDAVGTLRFGLRIYDVASPNERVALNFIIVIENKNDPMSDPRITSPGAGASFKVNQSFSLIGLCDDPDIQFGQVLNYTWESNISGLLGHGSSLTVRLMEPGFHRLTLTVRDPDFEKSIHVDVEIKPKEVIDPEPDPDPVSDPATINWGLIVGIIAVLGILGAVLFVVVGKQKTEDYEEQMDAEMHEEDKREALKRTAAAIKDVADAWETESEWEEDGTEDFEEIAVEADSVPSSQLSMEAKVTEAASEDTEKLWVGVSGAAVEQSEEEKEALRLDNLKRQYQNAIGRLPYGIPSKELADRDWVDLANALATGERKTLPDGREVTQIEGHWYYSDHEDTGTFLKEHGAKPKKEPTKAKPMTDREALLAKLEERFIMGEISEESYKELKRKFGGPD
jgi:hypothetical protein